MRSLPVKIYLPRYNGVSFQIKVIECVEPAFAVRSKNSIGASVFFNNFIFLEYYVVLIAVE
jgi:hypothetical protein